MRIVFAGTPEFAAQPLRALVAAGAEVVGVLSQPDRKTGRGRRLQPCPVRQAALDLDLPNACPASLREADALAPLQHWRPDLLVVIAYGQLLPPSVLEWPRLGCVNLHASLLPRWRGAAPIQRAIEAGDRETGLCLMRMEEGLDTGPVLASEVLPIGEDMTGGELHDALMGLGAARLPGWLQQLGAGELTAVPQPATGVSYARKLSKAEGQLDLQRSAAELARQIRAFEPWPVATVRHGDEALRLFGARAEAQDTDAAPGTLLGLDGDDALIATGEGVLRVRACQWPGRNRLPAAVALRSRELEPGVRFG